MVAGTQPWGLAGGGVGNLSQPFKAPIIHRLFLAAEINPQQHFLVRVGLVGTGVVDGLDQVDHLFQVKCRS
jgi:hypothetical protein